MYIKAVHAQTYGRPRMWRALRKDGIRVGKQRLQRLMRQHGIRAKGKKRFKVTTDSNHDLTDVAVSSFFFVNRDPLLADRASLVETHKLVIVQHFDTERAVESFNVGVLCRTTGLSELPLYAVGLGADLHDSAAKFRPIVTMHHIGLTVPLA